MVKSPASNTPARAGVPAELSDAARGERLQKVLAKVGVGSRRACEAMIEAGRVTVNGRTVAAMPAWVNPDRDQVKVDGKPIKGLPGKAKHEPTYIAVHKPRRVISTTHDPEGRPDVRSLVNTKNKARLFPVGRLDADSTGLMLLTDDGELANRLMHPRYEVAKEYLVVVRGRLEEKDLAKLREGLMLTAHGSAPASGNSPARRNKHGAGNAPGNRAAPASGGTRLKRDAGNRAVKRAAMEQVRIVRQQRDRRRGDRTLLSITLREGQNREIRRLLERRGVKVRSLKRTAIGPLPLKRLPVGQWRYLTTDEVAKIRKTAGLKNG